MAIKYRVGADGAITLPPDYLRAIGVRPGGQVTLHCTPENISIRAALPSCVFCGGESELVVFRDLCLCANCQNELAALKN